jgi:large subunit ribosomal protein L17
MRHRVAGRKLGRTTSHKAAMMRNMAASLIEHERIVTTIQKAKTVKPFVEKIVTLAKDPTQHHRRLAYARLRD